MYIYQQTVEEPRWMGTLVPIDGDAEQDKFYGTNVFNIRVFTKATPYVGIYDIGDLFADAHVDRLVSSYSTFAKYATCILFDEANIADDDPDADTFIEELQSICNQLSPYGFFYGGTVDSSSTDASTILTQAIADYYGVLANQA